MYFEERNYWSLWEYHLTTFLNISEAKKKNQDFMSSMFSLHTNSLLFIISDNPNVILPQNSVPKSIQGKWLHDLCCEFVNEYVFQSNDFLGLVNKTADLQTKSKPPFQCRVDGCDRSYLFHSARVRFVNLICYLANFYPE